MDAFVISLPAGPDAYQPCLTARRERLTQAGYGLSEAQTGAPSARSGRGATAQADPWAAIGLTALTNTAKLRARANAPEASPLDLIVRLRATEGPAFHDHLPVDQHDGKAARQMVMKRGPFGRTQAHDQVER